MYMIADEEYETAKYDNIPIESLMNSVSEMDQTMLKLKYLEGKSVKELQVQFNLGASAVKMRLQRAKQKIGQQINFSTECV
jgi:RNA polymerase sigma-70 factor (ECF subfamily)